MADNVPAEELLVLVSTRRDDVWESYIVSSRDLRVNIATV